MAPATTTIEIDSELLAQLRELDPVKSDRQLLEDVAVVAVGFDTIRRVQERGAATDEQEVMDEAVKATHEVRREMAAERQASRDRPAA